MECSVIIVSYNQSSCLYRCLKSVCGEIASSGIDAEVIVVDNASVDASVEVALHSGARIIRSDKNLGFASANNLGIKNSRGRYILLLNSDAALSRGSLAAMISELKAEETLGAVGALEIRPDKRIVRTWWSVPGLWRDVLRLLLPLVPAVSYVSAESLMKLPRIIKSDYLPGFCIMVRRDVIERVGGLAESMFFYGEDVEWGWRMNRAGWNTVVLRDISVIHDGGGSSGGLARARRHHLLALGRQDFYRLHHSERVARIYMGAVKASALMHICMALPFFIYPGASRIISEKRRLLRLLK